MPAATVVNVLSIVAIMALPLGMLCSLQMKRVEKFGLALIFCLGALEMALDLGRIVAWSISTSTAISITEPILALVLCPLPVYRGLLRRFRGQAVLDRVTSWLPAISRCTGNERRETSETRHTSVQNLRIPAPCAHTARAYQRESALLPTKFNHMESTFITTSEREETISLDSVDSAMIYRAAFSASDRK